ncbi:homocysteine S-methyltransferase family protein [Nereida sp. MMG025]|uniref:homocysteine S-methyltransferase family protein n=1 Tax=Nereida sp. MMG025 TaxID=2909981 RepID=UPI001F16AB6B|nr:homocysteine S-methyltransferase family protein [Nereida sp. MMG025]MCF6444819.1 homocysteine S-methyltransferase family protein [Nereida sp. MMG025]
MSQITLLDGGMGQELIHRAGDRPTPLWSTQVMIDRPGLVGQVHADFTAAGATVATLNTYASHVDRLADTEMAGQQMQLLKTAVAEAEGVRGKARIAGSIGPLIASYRPDIHPAGDVAIPLYRDVAQALAPHVDLIICETVASVDHARSVLTAAKETGLPVWLAVTVQDDDGIKLRSGEPVADVLPVLDGAAAVLVNCSVPEAIAPALAVLAQAGLPFGAYANAFTKISDGFLKTKPTVDALSVRHDITPAVYADHAMAWVDQGATIVGGCCEVSPAHISAIAERLRAAGHTIV